MRPSCCTLLTSYVGGSVFTKNAIEVDTITVALTAEQVGALAAFGGGILTALLIQDPKRAPIPLLSSNTVGLTWTICWWLINYFPGNLAARVLSLPPLKISAKVRAFPSLSPCLLHLKLLPASCLAGQIHLC